jgi:hypothetical protein
MLGRMFRITGASVSFVTRQTDFAQSFSTQRIYPFTLLNSDLRKE